MPSTDADQRSIRCYRTRIAGDGPVRVCKSKARVTIEPALDGAGRDLPDEALAPASFLARAHRSGAELKTSSILPSGRGCNRNTSSAACRSDAPASKPMARRGSSTASSMQACRPMPRALTTRRRRQRRGGFQAPRRTAQLRPRRRALSPPGGGERAFAFGPVAPAGRTDFFELGAGAAYAVDAALTVGARVAYAPDWFGSGRPASYGSLRAHYRLPEALVAGLPPGFALSGELGRMTIGSAAAGARIPDYTTWNFGASYSFDRFTIDLRYHDSDLSRKGCGALAAEMGLGLLNSPSGRCAAALVATLSVEFAVSEPGLANPEATGA